MIWVKVIHIAAISLWSAGLICLPALYLQRAHVTDEKSLHRLQALVRFLYVGAMSPAAFLGIATGTALIFLRQTWAPWFGVKLLFVGIMTVIHILAGIVIIRLFNAGQLYPAWRFVVVTSVTMITVSIILFLVLGKPDFPAFLPSVLGEPGALQQILKPLNPFQRS